MLITYTSGIPFFSSHVQMYRKGSFTTLGVKVGIYSRVSKILKFVLQFFLVMGELSCMLIGRVRILMYVVLQVNGNVLYGRSHLNASAIIKGLSTSDVKFVLLR